MESERIKKNTSLYRVNIYKLKLFIDFMILEIFYYFPNSLSSRKVPCIILGHINTKRKL